MSAYKLSLRVSSLTTMGSSKNQKQKSKTEKFTELRKLNNTLSNQPNGSEKKSLGKLENTTLSDRTQGTQPGYGPMGIYSCKYLP